MSDDQPPQPIPNVTVASRTNRSGTVTVRATNQGMPIEVKIDRAELRYGAESLAGEIMRLCTLATMEAGVRRREMLLEHGMTDDIIDRLGLPTRADVIAHTDADDAEDDTPRTWLRPV